MAAASMCGAEMLSMSQSAQLTGFRTPGSDVLVFVEVQHGDYFGEDDIVHLDDDYGRVPRNAGP